MTRPRNEIVDPKVTPYYHCISRCVRRAYLCGFDALTKKNFDHRKEWIEARLALLSQVFALEVCAYAVMSNHMHCLVRLNLQQAEAWTEGDVIARWGKIYSVPYIVQQYQKKECNEAEARQARETIEVWRGRLVSLSWYMRCLNEYIARLANREDDCTGKFWESRFKSQALLDEAAVLTCMAYIDLNPIRAGVTDSLETSEFTSIRQRLHDLACEQVSTFRTVCESSSKVSLMPLVKFDQDAHPNPLGVVAKDYIELVDWVGRYMVAEKCGKIGCSAPPVLEKLQLNPEAFLAHVSGRHENISIESLIALGVLKRLRQFAERLGAKFLRGQGIVPGLYRVS